MRLRVELPEGTMEWESDVALFRVGRADTCALRFEGLAAKYSSWEHAEFRRDDEGNTYVSDLESSNGTYVDGNRISEPTPLWVGAVVQIGTKGPKLQVLELPRPAKASATIVASGKDAANRQQQAMVIGLAAALLLAVGFFLFRGRGSPPPAQIADVAKAKEPAANDDNVPAEASASQPSAPTIETPPPVSPPPVSPPPVSSPPPPSPPTPIDPWQRAKTAALPTYRLIAIEDPKAETTWPFAGAVVVGPQALLTTADVAVELARSRQRGMNIKVLRDSDDSGVPVDRVRVHAAFNDAFHDGKPEEQLYFDLAILSTTQTLAGAANLPTAAELAAIERSQPLICAAIRHTGDAINRFEPLKPEWHAGKVFNLTALSSDAGAPRLLHLKGDFNEKFLGSPIFNDRGELLALYCEPAPDEGGQPERAVHYAALIEPELIELGLKQSENEIWVAPVVPPEPTKKEDPAK